MASRVEERLPLRIPAPAAAASAASTAHHNAAGGGGGSSSGASLLASAINISKVCVGTGMLALPFAIAESGVLVGALGLALIALWNRRASSNLSRLRQRLHCDTYASLAERIFGPFGRLLVDVCTVSTLLGACTVYLITFATLLHDTPLALGPNAGRASLNPWRETLLCALLVTPLAVWRHLKLLANTSALGLLALIAGFGTVFVFGVMEFGLSGSGGSGLLTLPLTNATTISEGNDLGLATSGGMKKSSGTCSGVENEHGTAAVKLLPSGQLSHFFGIAAFCYGICHRPETLRIALRFAIYM